MKCPTCKKTVRRGQTVCAFCGALVGEPPPPSYVTKQDTFQAPTFERQRGPVVREPAMEESDWPVFGPMVEGERESPAEPGEEPGTPSAPARPTPPAWVRLISPIFFILVFVVAQYWLRESEQSRPSRSEQPAETQPVLRQGGFVSELPEGHTVQPRTVFSRQDDPRIIFISTWRGSPRGHSYDVEWQSPAGTTRPSASVQASTQPGGRGFSVIATLNLDSSLPAGLWRVEVSQDNRVVSRYSFQLKE